nr:enoyl-CoA hydratase-related protein [Novosphingobium hassiacum]
MIVTINRPQARNAINLAVHMGIGEALEEAQADASVRAIVLTGSGDQAFCAGADLKALARGEPMRPENPDHIAWGFAGYVSHAVSKPTIAAVNGVALGGGTELTLASDLAVASETATFGLPEVKRGLCAGAGGAFRLAQQVSPKVAMEILLTGDPITAHRALELGLVNAVVPGHELLYKALELANRIAINAPLSVQASKRIALGIADGRIASDEPFWALSAKETAGLMQSDDTKEGSRAFVEKRAPHWTGR